jgi:two-component system cell cycle sensor histidine kinase/response regulator CckA
MKTIATSFVQSMKIRAANRATTVSDRPMSILVVDDEESILRYLDRVLSDAGHRTTMAANGADAIAAAARGGRFDLLLTDVVMPEMTGAELALRLRQDDPDLKVLYLTGYSDRLFAEKISLCNEEAFLEKPCSVVGLLQAVSLATTGSIGIGSMPPSDRWRSKA